MVLRFFQPKLIAYRPIVLADSFSIDTLLTRTLNMLYGSHKMATENAVDRNDTYG